MFNAYLGNPSANTDFWYKDASGRIKAGISHPETKTALTYWAKWYKEGIINPDFANTDSNKMLEDIVNGKTGMEPYHQWQGWHAGPNLVATQGSDNAYMIPLPFPTVNGSQVMGQVGFPNGTLIVINKDCANPAAVMKVLSHVDHIMFDPTTVLTEAEFRGYTDGQREHAPGAFEIIDPQADMIQFEHVLHALKTGDTSELFTAGMKKKYGDSIAWLTKKDTGGLGAYLQQGFDGCAYDNSKFLLDNNFIVKTDMWGPPPEDFDQTVNAFDVVVQGFTKIIQGQEPVDSYDKIIADWYANGGKIMEDAVNRDYNK
jgi:putative aldouronate transport system substrate-binding protein